MRAKTLKRSIEEAKRFIKAAEAVSTWKSDNGNVYVNSGKEAAACKRASMDLSRALSDLRMGR